MRVLRGLKTICYSRLIFQNQSNSKSEKLETSIMSAQKSVPQVLKMKLPTPLMKGFMVLPSINLANCNIRDCEFVWYRRISAKERLALITRDASNEDKIELSGRTYWYKLKDGVSHVPSDDDLAHYLKVVCRPINGTDSGPIASCTSGKPVELGPMSWPFEGRQKYTADRLPPGNAFRVVSYNILAGIYTGSEYAKTTLFAHCPSYALKQDYRRQLLVKEIDGYNSDIVCLQEVDISEFDRTYDAYFKAVGDHSGVFHPKAERCHEGVATFFRNDRFELVDSHATVLSRLVDTQEISIAPEPEDSGSNAPKERMQPEVGLENHPILSDRNSSTFHKLTESLSNICSAITSNSALLKRFLSRPTVLQTTLLRSKDNRNTYVIVANTHLYFAPDADHIRLLQGSICVKYLEFMKEHYGQVFKFESFNYNPRHVRIIFCGDMNSSPDCGLFRLMHEGFIDESLTDWSSNKEESVQGLRVETSLQFRSAYESLPYTNYTPEFHACLDYIYYETNGIDCLSTVPLPRHEDVTATGGIPSPEFPSDHIALIANLEFQDSVAPVSEEPDSRAQNQGYLSNCNIF